MPALLSQEETKILNATFFEKVLSDDPGTFKEASDAVNDFTRTTMREDGFMRRIIPPITLTNDELDRSMTTEKPIKIVDREPTSPAAISISFAALPNSMYIRAQRYAVTMNRIVTPRWTKDVDELRTWIMDIRQVLSDNSIKDMLAEEDGKLTKAINTALVAQGAVVPTSGTVQWLALNGGITRDSLWESMKIMPGTPSNLEVHTVLLNNLTIKDVNKLTRNEMGGDLSQDIMKQGWSDQEFMGKRWIVTIKKTLVPNGTMYHFADPRFIGKVYQLEDTVLYVRREAYMLEFFGYETLGGSIGHTSGIARADFV